MKRAVLCVPNPHDYIDQLDNYSIMIINPEAPDARKQYLLDKSDWSLKITGDGEQWRDGGDYANERVFWYTSGTTGDSKFYGFTQQQLDIMARRIVASYDIGPNDRYVGIMPLWHAHGQGFYWATKLAGCESTFLSVKHLKSLPEHAPTFITAVPNILSVLATFRFQHLRFIRSASAALPDSLYMALQGHGVPVIEAFGMTEALSHCFTNPLHGEQRMGTVGLPDGIDAKIQQGHLLISGSTVCEAGWLDTGDLAEQDSAGYYRILGRSVDQLNIKGRKFNPLSLENQILQQFAGMRSCVIFGDKELNCLYVGDCTEQDIKKFLRTLDPYLRPTLLKQVDEIPLQSSGKISRSYLKSLYDCK